MDKVTRQMRVVAFALLSLVLAVAYTALTATTTGAQSDEPCSIEDEEELGPCIEGMEHQFQDSCEGNDCYPALEICCLGEIIVT